MRDLRVTTYGSPDRLAAAIRERRPLKVVKAPYARTAPANTYNGASILSSSGWINRRANRQSVLAQGGGDVYGSSSAVVLDAGDHHAQG